MRVRARDFLSWAEFDRELGKGVTLIRGFNYDDGTEEGCGKSAVPNIMSWCIFGEIPKEALIDDVIREGCKGCETEVYLPEFSVFRSRNPNDLHIKFANGKIFRGKDARETQKKIIELVGMTFATFCQSIYFAQNFPMKFITANQEMKGKILSEILDLEQFDRARKVAADRIKVLKEELVNAESDLRTYTDRQRQEGFSIISFEDLIKEFEKEKGEKIRKLLNDHAAIDEKAQNYMVEFNATKDHNLKTLKEQQKEVQTLLGKLSKEFVSLEKALNELPLTNEVREEIKSLEEKLEAINAIREDAKVKLGSLEADIRAFNKAKRDVAAREEDLAKLENKIESYKKDIKHQKSVLEICQAELDAAILARDNPSKENCPTCGQAWDGDPAHYEKEVTKAKKSYQNVGTSLSNQESNLEQLKADKIELLNKLSAMKADLKEPKASNAKLEDLIQETTKDAGLVKEAIKDLRASEGKATELKSELKILQSKIDRQLERAEGLKNAVTSTKAETPDQAMSSFEDRRKRIESEIEAEDAKEPITLRKKLSEAVANNAKSKLEAERAQERVDALKTRVVRLESLREGFRDVKAYTFENTLRQLNSKANKYMVQLFNQQVKIRFKNEDLKIETTVNIDGHERALGLYSGGQFRRIALAVDLALSDITLARKGNKLNFMCFDEYCKDLSLTSMKKILKILQNRKVPTIMIEHNEIFRSIVSDTIDIEFKNGISVLNRK